MSSLARPRMGAVIAFVVAVAWATPSEALEDAAEGQYRAARAAFAREVGPVELEAYRLPDVPDSRNAAVPIVRALEVYRNIHPKGSMDSLAAGEFLIRPVDTWKEADVPALKAELERYRRVLDVLAEASGRTESTFHLPVERGVAVSGPDLLAVVDVMKLVAADGQLAVHDGRWSDAANDAAILSTAARSMSAEAPAVYGMLGRATEVRQLDLLGAILAQDGPDRAVLDRLGATIGLADPIAAYRRSLAFDYVAVAQETAEMIENDVESPQAKRDAGFAFLARLLAFRTDEFRSLAGPYRAAAAAVERVVESHRRVWSAVSDDEARLFLVLAEWDPDVRTYGRCLYVASMRRLARIAIAVRLQALDRGRYPADIADLERRQGVDPLTGERLDYTVAADGSATLGLHDAAPLLEEIEYGVTVPPITTWNLPVPGTGLRSLRR